MLLRVEGSSRPPSIVAHGSLRVASDKSITQRALLLASIAHGTSRLFSPLDADDPRAVRRVIERLGARVVDVADGLEVTGAASLESTTSIARSTSATGRVELDFANSGTGARLAMGLFAGRGVAATVTGDASLRSRPMGRVVRPLQRMGVEFEGADLERLPLSITPGRPLVPFVGELEVASAQVKSAVLLAALGAHGPSRVVERRPTRDHTETMLPRFGVECRVERASTTSSTTTIALRGPAELRATTVRVPADPSAAAFPAAIAALAPGSRVRFDELLLSPRRAAFFDWLAKTGASVATIGAAERDGELVGAVDVGGADELRGVDVAPEQVPDLVDELPLVAVVAALARGSTTVRGARELRFKESDRIAAMGEGLTRMGARFVALDDGFVVEGSGASGLHGAEVDSRGDHRVAMALAVAALFASGTTTISNWECAAVSYPRFVEDVTALLGGARPFELLADPSR